MDAFFPRQCVNNGNNTLVFSGRRERRERIPTVMTLRIRKNSSEKRDARDRVSSGLRRKLGGQFGRRRRGGGFRERSQDVYRRYWGRTPLALSRRFYFFFFSLPPSPPSHRRRKLHARLLQPAAVRARVRLRVRERRPRRRDLWPRRMINHPELPPPRVLYTHTRARPYIIHTRTRFRRYRFGTGCSQLIYYTPFVHNNNIYVLV